VQRELFSQLLEESDNDLLDWALGRGQPRDCRYLPVVELLRAA
jgi:succinate dehydrogenase flavin-adding protein (antitoxin of CptAB toxin-antitoxin module)